MFAGCENKYAPKKLSEKQKEIKSDLVIYTDNLKNAFASSSDYIQVAIIKRSTKFPDDKQTYSKVLVLQNEQLDLDDYGFSLPGKEASESEKDQLNGFFDIMFWVNKDGEIFFDDFEQPPGCKMVVEWCVPNVTGNKVSLHYGGEPCLTIDLTKK